MAASVIVNEDHSQVFAVSKSSGAYMPHLDGLRCFAVLVVIWEHAGPPLVRRFGFMGLGVYGVWLFFTLSAFLITGILLRVRDSRVTLGQALRTFYARRFLRIFPAYYALLLVIVIAGVPMAKGDLAAHLAYLSNWRIIYHNEWPQAIGHFWSLSVEEQFYLVWPLLILLVPDRRLPWLFVGAALLAVMTRAAVALSGANEIAVQLSTFANLDSLACGALLAWHCHSFPDARDVRQAVLAWGCRLGILLLGVTFALSIYGRGFRLFAVEEGLAASLIAVWLVDRCAQGVIGRPRLLLEWRPVAYIGTISYGVYLFHLPLLWSFRAIGRAHNVDAKWIADGSVQLFVVTLLATVLVASLSWRFFERPINELKRYFPYPKSQVQLREDGAKASFVKEARAPASG